MSLEYIVTFSFYDGAASYIDMGASVTRSAQRIKRLPLIHKTLRLTLLIPL